MRMSKIVLSVFLSLSVVSGAGAATISLSVVQNEQAPAIALDMSRTIEDELFGNFFDAGHIISNSDIRFDGSRFVEANYGIKEAAFGLSDFLVVVSLHYGPAEKKDTETKLSYAELDSLAWRVVRVLSSEILGESTIDVSKVKVTDFDPYRQSRIVADLVGAQTIAVVRGSKRGEKK